MKSKFCGAGHRTKKHPFLTQLFNFIFLSGAGHRLLIIPFVFHFNLDGLRYDTLKKNLEAGRLPNIQKYLVDEGAWYHRAVTVFPSVSTSAYASFYTGLPPAESGVPFLEWYDRRTHKVTGYLSLGGKKKLGRDLRGPTLFEELAPYGTAAIYNPFERGAQIKIPKKFPWRVSWETGVLHDGTALDRNALRKFTKLLQRPVDDWPHFISTALFSTDYLGHHDGPQSGAIDDNLQKFDLFLGELMQMLIQKGLSDQTYLLITSDHGMHATQKHFNLKKRLKKAGFTSKDFYLSNRGVSTNFLYLLGDKKEGLIETLQQQPEIEWLAIRDGTETRILAVSGAPNAVVDAVFQLQHIFDDERSGDILIQLKPPWLFRKDKNGTHGSLSDEDMQIVFMMRGPRVQPGPRGFARSTEVYSLIHSWFSEEK